MKGDGSTYETKDAQGRNRWVAQVFVEGRDHPARRRLPVGATKRQAQAELRRMRDQRARGELGKKAKPDEPERLPTIGEWMQRWVEGGCVGGLKAQKRRAGAGTRDMYSRLIRLDIAPSRLARMRLDEVRRRHASDFLAERAKAGRSESTLQKEIGALFRAWREAQDRYEEVLGDRSNPFDVALPETKDAAERRALDVPEIRAALTASAEHRMLGAWVRLAIDCGARPSELAALEWADLDLEATPPTVTIAASIAWEPRPEDEPGEGAMIARLTEGKTGRGGWRKLTLSPSTVQALRAHKRSMQVERMRLPGYWPAEQDGIDLGDRVFRSEAGKLVHYSNVNHQLQAAAKRSGLGKVSPYELRHTAATLIDEHHGEAVASKALGHSTKAVSSTTAGYIHRRRLPVVDSACLDLALSQADDTKAVGQ